MVCGRPTISGATTPGNKTALRVGNRTIASSGSSGYGEGADVDPADASAIVASSPVFTLSVFTLCS